MDEKYSVKLAELTQESEKDIKIDFLKLTEELAHKFSKMKDPQANELITLFLFPDSANKNKIRCILARPMKNS